MGTMFDAVGLAVGVDPLLPWSVVAPGPAIGGGVPPVRHVLREGDGVTDTAS